MDKNHLLHSRRLFLRHVGAAGVLGATALWTPGVFAEELTLTPRQTEGPFYPDRLPLDADNDLLLVSDATRPAVGTVTHLRGRILDRHGQPIRNAVVEIWQVDANGIYLHTADPREGKRDSNFQGFGRFQTGSKGEYYFRTIKPVPYVPRSAGHIHFKVKVKGQDPFTTQCYVKGSPGNERDFVLNAIRDAKARESVIVDFRPLEGSRIGELSARFDVVLGFTPAA
ncbi:MAG: twin-arginine translocation signal domain-containing protein [Acidobacteria bacterium]|nr:MAG: twin-arginine translocation signal domain-containing protein [Acidobacteriota bacterium]